MFIRNIRNEIMISVCMSTYNGEQFIFKQLDSILSQIGLNDEVIISDDGSKDNSYNKSLELEKMKSVA